MLNKYREITYTDDGCTLYECLSCKAEWESRYFPKTFCANCGIKFDGKLEWNREESGAYRRVKYYRPEPHITYYVEYERISEDGTFNSGWKCVYGGHDINYDKNPLFSDLVHQLDMCLREIRSHRKKTEFDSYIEKEYGFKYNHNYRIVKTNRVYGDDGVLKIYNIKDKV